MLYPATFEQKISFNTIRFMLKGKCLCSLGEEKVDEMHFSSTYKEVMKWVNQTDEMLRLISQEADELPVGDFFDVRDAFSRVQVVGLYIDENEIYELRRSLEAVRKLILFITRQDENLFPQLHSLISGISSFENIIKRIDAILDKFGKIKDNASPALANIRKDIFRVQSGISKTLHSILRQAQADGYVEKDVSPTMREGR
ncbi:MAG: Smr protein/MutS2 [Bacteroidetes bacterium]|nr:Smr protein/MutS2 [Bacteroidota bacterium]